MGYSISSDSPFSCQTQGIRNASGQRTQPQPPPQVKGKILAATSHLPGSIAPVLNEPCSPSPRDLASAVATAANVLSPNPLSIPPVASCASGSQGQPFPLPSPTFPGLLPFVTQTLEEPVCWAHFRLIHTPAVEVYREGDVCLLFTKVPPGSATVSSPH